MKFYEVTSNGIYENDGTAYFGDKVSAINAAKTLAKNGNTATVDIVIIDKTNRSTILSALNGHGNFSHRETILELF